MAYTVETQGMDEIGEMLAALGEQAPAVAAKGLYDGAGVIADRINRGAESIRTEPFHYAKFITRMPSPEEKEAIISAGAGIAKFDKTCASVIHLPASLCLPRKVSQGKARGRSA